ncbi:MAG: flagellar biosynthesis anti-sigma factor FlgM [Deltaproteobacteria bacterium]
MKVTHNPTPNPYTTETKVDNTKNAQKAAKTQGVESSLGGVGTASRSGADVEISDGAQLMRQASEIAKSFSENRADKLEALKKSIQAGTYHVDAKEIADRLVDEHMNSDFGKNSL